MVEIMNNKKLKIKNIVRRDENVAVKHTPTNVVHKGSKGGTTGCGSNTNENITHWVNVNDRIDCDKNGCRN